MDGAVGKMFSGSVFVCQAADWQVFCQSGPPGFGQEFFGKKRISIVKVFVKARWRRQKFGQGLFYGLEPE
jgi:hypothetical protein